MLSLIRGSPFSTYAPPRGGGGVKPFSTYAPPKCVCVCVCVGGSNRCVRSILKVKQGGGGGGGGRGRVIFAYVLNELTHR